jgi:hypothetical protein
MKNVRFEVTQRELLLLIALTSDQLFRREFIDPKMPGYRADPADLAMGKQLVLRLKSVIQPGNDTSLISKREPGRVSPKINGIPNGV